MFIYIPAANRIGKLIHEIVSAHVIHRRISAPLLLGTKVHILLGKCAACKCISTTRRCGFGLPVNNSNGGVIETCLDT